MLSFSFSIHLLIICGSLSWLTEAQTVNRTAKKRSKVCYKHLGCFRNNGPFSKMYSLVSYLPQSPEKIDPKFKLFSRQNLTEGHTLTAGDTATLKQSTFLGSRPTKIIVHGFSTSTTVGTWMQDIMTELLHRGDYNVIIVTWNSYSLYGQATANTRVVGAMIAQLITFLQNKTQARPENMHIIGHSLGSHIAGYAGERLQSLGRITGLDPAEPYFQNMHKAVRLDPSDALFVDIIHTDGASFYSTDLGFGMSQACGHVDFYVNGGHDQPGCQRGTISYISKLGLMKGTVKSVSCNHMRAYKLFKESINSACPFQGYRCASEDDFNQGKCLPCRDEDCDYMGFHAHQVKPTAAPATNKYYLKTGSGFPFCRYHYKVALNFSSSGRARKERGTMYVAVIGSQGRIKKSKLTEDDMYIRPGSTYTYILTSATEIGDVHDVKFRWVHHCAVFDFKCWNLLGQRRRQPTLYLDSIQVVSGEEKKTKKLCGDGIAVPTRHTVRINKQC